MGVWPASMWVPGALGDLFEILILFLYIYKYYIYINNIYLNNIYIIVGPMVVLVAVCLETSMVFFMVAL